MGPSLDNFAFDDTFPPGQNDEFAPIDYIQDVSVSHMSASQHTQLTCLAVTSRQWSGRFYLLGYVYRHTDCRYRRFGYKYRISPRRDDTPFPSIIIAVGHHCRTYRVQPHLLRMQRTNMSEITDREPMYEMYQGETEMQISFNI